MKISIFAATVLAVMASAEAAQHHKIKLSKSSSVVPDSYIIELENTFSGSHAQFLNSVSSKFNDAGLSMRQSYNSELFKGMSVKIKNTASSKAKRGLHHAGSTAVLNAIADSPQVRNIYPVSVIPRPKVNVISTGHTNSPDVLFADTMTQVQDVHNYGYKGKGITVGIIDTGKYFGVTLLCILFYLGCP
jgi:opacity protein-like surface antigen